MAKKPRDLFPPGVSRMTDIADAIRDFAAKKRGPGRPTGSKSKPKAPKVDRVRFAVISSNASKDVWIDRQEAREAFQRGEIAVDLTNSGSDEGTVYMSINGTGNLPPKHITWHRTKTR